MKNRGHGRLVFCACLTLLVGCGARTSTFDDEFGGENAGGAAGFGGSHPIPAGGAPFGGAPSAGAPFGGFGGGHAGAAGAPGAGAAGAPGAGAAGAPGAGAGGAPLGGFAGFGAIGGDAGTGGIGQLCGVLGGSTCAQCQCQTCAPAIEGCFSDTGCALIFLCAQQAGCNGLSCYSPTCQPVIDQYGGLAGASIRKVFSLLTCAASSQASCGC